MKPNHLVKVSGILGFLGVALGAFGAHGLKSQLLANNTTQIWETAVFYHLIHAVALFALSRSTAVSRVAALGWIAGTVVFSGSLYVLALTNMKWLGAITPFGGVAFLIGWGCLVISRTQTPQT